MYYTESCTIVSYYTLSIQNIIITIYTFFILFILIYTLTGWLCNAFSIFATASGVYPEIFAWSYIVIFLHILSCRIEKKKEINISNMTTHQTSSKWQYLTCNQSFIFNPKLEKKGKVTPRL